MREFKTLRGFSGSIGCESDGAQANKQTVVRFNTSNVLLIFSRGN